MLHFVQPFPVNSSHSRGITAISTATGSWRVAAELLAAENGDRTLGLAQRRADFMRTPRAPGDNCVELDAEVTLPDRRSVPASWLTLVSLEDLHLDDARREASRPPKHPCPRRPHFSTTHTGLVSLRSGWRPDDTLVVFDAGHA